MATHRWQSSDGALGLAASWSSGTAPSVAATGTLTLTGTVADGEQVTIDAKTYTYKTAINDANDGEVLIGASFAKSAENLAAAVDLDLPVSGRYATATTLHPTVTASDAIVNEVAATAKTKGSDANTLATTETIANGSWGGATLSGGTQWAATDKVAFDGTNSQPILTNIGPASPFVEVAELWIQRDFLEDGGLSGQEVDFLPLVFTHQGSGSWTIKLPDAVSKRVLIVCDSPNASEALRIDSAGALQDLQIVAKIGKVVCAAGLTDINFLETEDGAVVDLPDSGSALQEAEIRGGIVTNRRAVATPGDVRTYGGFFTHEEGAFAFGHVHGGRLIYNASAGASSFDVFARGVLDFNNDLREKAMSDLRLFLGATLRSGSHVTFSTEKDFRNDTP